MEFDIEKSRFQDELSHLIGVIEKKSPIPILESIRITGDGLSKIHLVATNLDLGILSSCQTTKITGKDSFCAPSHKLFDIIKLMPDGLINVSNDANQWIHIKAKNSKFRIPGANPASFPEIAAMPPPEDWVTISAKLLKLLLRGVEFAMSPSQNERYSIAGIKIEINDSGIRLVGTDGHRLSISSAPSDMLLLNSIDVLLPRKAVSELSKLLGEGDGAVGIAVTSNDMFFNKGGRILYSRLLTGQYPAYQSVLSSAHPYFATFPSAILAQSIKRAMVVTDEKLAGVYFHFKDGRVHISASTADSGHCDEILDTNYNGPEVRIPCSGKYLTDFLEQLGGDTVKIEIKDNKMPLFLKASRGNIVNHYILSPMRDKEAKSA